MQFTRRDIEGVRTAIKGLGADNVFALAMALKDGIIQVEILKRIDEGLQTIALAHHPFYTSSWEDVNNFLDSTFTDRPDHAVKVSDFAGFNQTRLLASM